MIDSTIRILTSRINSFENRLSKNEFNNKIKFKELSKEKSIE